MAETRELDGAATIKRIRALDALYLNADRRYREWAAIDPREDSEGGGRAYSAWCLAMREYERVRDTPYTLASGA